MRWPGVMRRVVEGGGELGAGKRGGEGDVGGGSGAPPLPPRRSSRMVGRRLACRDAADLLGPLKCRWTTYVPLDHLVHGIRWSNGT